MCGFQFIYGVGFVSGKEGGCDDTIHYLFFFFFLFHSFFWHRVGGCVCMHVWSVFFLLFCTWLEDYVGVRFVGRCFIYILWRFGAGNGKQ
jgi:hypothetical protein